MSDGEQNGDVFGLAVYDVGFLVIALGEKVNFRVCSIVVDVEELDNYEVVVSGGACFFQFAFSESASAPCHCDAATLLNSQMSAAVEVEELNWKCKIG